MEVNMKLHCLNAVFAAAVLLFAGCAGKSEAVKKDKVAMALPHGQVKYEKVKADGLSLKILGNPVARAGRPGVITFALANDGVVKVNIPEWFSNESDNVGIYVQPLLSGMVEPDDSKWVRLEFEFKKPVMHYPVTLMPGNKLLISKQVDFIKNMMVKPGEERMFFFRGDLTLESLPLSSRVGILRVTSNVERGK